MPKFRRTSILGKKKRKRLKTSNDSDSDSDEDESNQKAQGNHLYFWCDVTKKTCLSLSLQLNNCFNKLNSLAYPGDTIPPIYLHINSYGGEVDAALAVIDTIISLKKQGAEIITIIEGYAASAATMISVVGSERRIRPHSYMRIHQFSSGMWGKKDELDDEHENLSKLEQILINLYKEHTNMKKKDLKALLKRELDLLPEECIKCGLIDCIQE